MQIFQFISLILPRTFIRSDVFMKKLEFCMCVCVRARVCLRVSACVHVSAYVYVCIYVKKMLYFLHVQHNIAY